MIKYLKFFIIFSSFFIALNILASSSLLKGRIVDAKTGKPLAATNIEIVGTSIGTAADDKGNFAIQDLPPGKYTIRITQIGYKPVEKNIRIIAGELMLLRIALEPTIIEGHSKS